MFGRGLLGALTRFSQRVPLVRWKAWAPRLALAALVMAIALVALLALLFPHQVYDPIIWRYYWGPIVSDYAGEPLTRGGVTAYSGYNAVNLGTWAVILGISVWNVSDVFKRRGLQFTRALTYSLVPMIIAGGTMRGLIEINWLSPPWAYLFITPNIYFVFFFYTVAALLVGLSLERKTGERFRHWHATFAAGAIAMLITWAAWGWYVINPPQGLVRWSAMWEIFGYSALLTAALVAILWIPKVQFVRDPLYVLVLYGQVVDGMQNYVGITKGYTSKLMGTNFLAAIFGDAGLLIGKVALFVPLLAYLKARVEPEEDPSTVQFVLLAILALGLAMGFHGGVGLLLDV